MLGDGILYKISVRVDGETNDEVLAETRVTKHEWLPIEADLSRYAGKRVYLTVTVDAFDSSDGDWACLADARLESTEQYLKRTLKSLSLEK